MVAESRTFRDKFSLRKVLANLITSLHFEENVESLNMLHALKIFKLKYVACKFSQPSLGTLIITVPEETTKSMKTHTEEHETSGDWGRGGAISVRSNFIYKSQVLSV